MLIGFLLIAKHDCVVRVYGIKNENELTEHDRFICYTSHVCIDWSMSNELKHWEQAFEILTLSAYINI